MDCSIEGRLKNISLASKNYLLPLFEAIANSIDSIEDREESESIENPYIKIEVIFNELIKEKQYNHVIGFKVADNGIGFTQTNYNSFNTSDSPLKINSGGKGLGRFLWLKAFEKARVESLYKEGEALNSISFNFVVSEEGLEKTEGKKNIDTKTPIKTTISLLDYKEKYSQKCPSDLNSIAREIMEHFLQIFLGSNKLNITLNAQDTCIDLNQLFETTIRSSCQEKQFDVQNQNFNAYLIKLAKPKESKVYLCANQRVVENKALQANLPDILGLNEFSLAIYVYGEYLDQAVNQTRTGFNIEDEEASAAASLFTNISQEKIIKEAIKSLGKELDKYLVNIRTLKKEQVITFVDSKAPEYKALMEYYSEETIAQLPHTKNEEELELALHEIKNKKSMEVKKENNKIIQEISKGSSATDEQSFRSRHQDNLQKITDFAKSELSNYIMYRKSIIDLLGMALVKGQNGEYRYENFPHAILMPLKASSRGLQNNHNLWLLDEKFTFHLFTTSDLRISSNQRKEDAGGRPDILIYDKPYVYSDPVEKSSIIIIELKRPGRDNYSNEDPIEQIYSYVSLVQNNAKDYNGRPIPVGPGTKYFSYLICDVHPLRGKLEKTYEFTEEADGESYFKLHKSYGFIQVVSYDRVLNDARLRNKPFTEKLRI